MNPNLQQVARPNPATQQPVTTEYSIRVPKDGKKKHHVMKFNGNLKIDFKDWKGKSVKMERENNMKNFRELDEDAPKFGAGSEFGREAREEARRKKFGVASKQYKPDDQPWVLKLDGKNGRKFRGVREGGISENASYYIFTHGANGIIEAFPLKEWYNFQPVQRYKALSAEEAEEEFSRRNKVMNYFNLMLKKRLRNDEEEGEDAELEAEKGKKSGKKNKDFKISEMDDWVDDDDDNSDSDKEAESDDGNDGKKKKKGAPKKKKKRASDSEAFEESDDGDEEGRECDYISDSSASESDLETQKEMKSVAEEDALRKLLASDEEDEDEEKKKDEEDKNEEDEEENGKEKDEKEKNKAGKSKDKGKDGKKKKDGSDSSSDAESGTSPIKDDKKPASTHSSRSATPTAAVAAASAVAAGPSTSESLKRPAPSATDISPAKKVRLETNYALANTSSSAESRTITEDAVRRYLMRKPMTARELCQKFKRKSGLSSDELVDTMTKILRNINPTSQKIKEKTYFSIKTEPKQMKPQAD